MALIHCQGLTRTYPKGDHEVTPLAGLDLEVEAGEFVALMGPSGSGKTTLLNLLAGIDRPSAGQLMVDGVDIAQMSRAALADWRARAVGYVFQLYNLVPVLTAYENVELPLLLRSMSRKERHAKVELALQLTGIADRHDHFPKELSGGQEQRVAIARAIVTDPALILADEPTGDLDRTTGRAIMELLVALNRELHKTLVMVTHDPEIARYARRHLLLGDGRIVSDEPVLEGRP